MKRLRASAARHTCRQTEEAYALARQMGFSHINMDLIAGLPGENLQMFEETLAWLRSLAPESMTVHTLSIKRSSLLHLWEAQLPTARWWPIWCARAHGPPTEWACSPTICTGRSTWPAIRKTWATPCQGTPACTMWK